MTEQEIKGIIDFGRSQGYDYERIKYLVDRRKQEQEHAAAKAAYTQKLKEETDKGRSAAQVVTETVDSNALVEFKGESSESQKTILDKYNKDYNTNLTSDAYKKMLEEKRVSIDDDLDARFKKISETKQSIWNKNKEGKRDVKGGLLDMMDNRFIVGTLSREYGDIGFSFEKSGKFESDDQITAYYTDSNGKKHTSETIYTNYMFGGGKKEEAQGHMLEAWMKEVYKADHTRDTDYRPIKNEDGKYEWHYTDGEESLGKVTSSVLIDKLSSQQKNWDDPNKHRSYKYDNDGQLLYREEYGADRTYKPVTNETEKTNHELLYPNAKQNALDRKEGEEAQIYGNSVRRDRFGDIETIKNRKIYEDEYQKRLNTPFNQYYIKWRNENMGAAGTGDRLKSLLSYKTYSTLWQQGGINLDDYEEFEEKVVNNPDHPIHEDYAQWIEEAKDDRIPEKGTDDDIAGTGAYVLKDDGSYSITDNELERLAELNIKPSQDQLNITATEYEFKTRDENRNKSSTTVKAIETFWGKDYAGNNSISELVQLAQRKTKTKFGDDANYVASSEDIGFKAGEYTLNGKTINVTEEDVAYFDKWHTHYNEHNDQTEKGKKHYEKLDQEEKDYFDRNRIAQNIRFKNENKEISNEETTPKRKEELKKHIKDNQSNWSKFYNIEDLPPGIDIDEFEKYVTEQMGDGMLSNLGIVTHGTDVENKRTSASLQWDEQKGKWFMQGGGGEVDITDEITGVSHLDNIRANALAMFINSEIGKNEQLAGEYVAAGTSRLISGMNNVNDNVLDLDKALQPIIEEYETLKSDIDSGKVKSSIENLEELDKLSVRIGAFNEAINSNVDSYNKITNNERNLLMLDNWNNLVDRTAQLQGAYSNLIDPNSTNPFNIIARQGHEYQLRRQERLTKMEGGHVGWGLASMGEFAWQSLIGGISGVVGIAEAHVPGIWGGGGTAEDKLKIMSSWNNVAKNLTWDAVAEGSVIDPETKEVNWMNVAPTTAVVVADMYMMMGVASMVKGAGKAVVKRGGGLARRAMQGLGVSKTALGRVGKYKNMLGRVATKASLADRAAQFSGGMAIIYPKNVEEAVLHIDENFTAEDAMNSAFWKTTTESAIEMINPDIKMFRQWKTFRGSKEFGNWKLWLSGKNTVKSLNLFGQSLSRVPVEMIEENTQEFANGIWNGYYNQHHKTDFHLPTAEDYRELNIITPISILSSGFISTGGFRHGKPNASMYLAAVEDYDEFSKELGSKVDLYELDKANGVPEKNRRGLEPKEFERIMTEVNSYVAIKSSIPNEHWNNMTNGEQAATLSLLYEQHNLNRKVREEKDPKKKEKLKNDLKNVNLDIQRVANEVETGHQSRQEQQLNAQIQLDKILWKNAERGSEERAKITKRARENTKKRNELRDKAANYEFNGKQYNNASKFIQAIKNAKENGYFENLNNRPRIRIGNKVESAKAEYLVNMIDKLTGVNTFRSGEVLMDNNTVQETYEFMGLPENQGKTLQDFKNELSIEESKDNPDTDRLNDLRNAVKFGELGERGYFNSKTAGGMIIDARDNKALRKQREQKLDKRIEAVKDILKEAGTVMEMTAEEIKSLEDLGFIDKGVHKTNAFMWPRVDPKTGKMRRVLIVNKTVALATSNLSAPSHDLLHAALFSAINGPLRRLDAIDPTTGKPYTTHITKEGVKLIRGFLKLLPKKHLAILEAEMELRGYKHDENNDGSINKDAPLPFELYAEEYLTVYHDLVVNPVKEGDQMVYKIPLDSPDTRSTLRKIADYFIYWWKGEVREELQEVMNTKLDTPQKVLEFMRNFNRQAMTDKYSDQLIEMAMTSHEFYGEVVPVEEMEVLQKSKVNQTDIKSSLDKFVQKPDGTKKYETKKEFQESSDFTNAWSSITDSDLLDGMIKNQAIAEGLTVMPEGFVQQVKERISERFIKNFDPAKNESLFGWLTGKTKAGRSILKLSAGDVANKVKKQIPTRSESEAIIEQTKAEERTKQRESRKIKLADRLGVTSRVNKTIAKILPTLNIAKLNFKKLKNLIPEITGKMFGISPKKIISGANITKGELQSAQMFINKNADILIAMLPEGHTVSGTSTGIPKVLLDAFYTKGKRAKMAKTGTKAGLAVQNKNPNITKKQFLEVFGIVNGKPVRSDRNTSARVLALANLTGKMMSNQAVREAHIKNESSPSHVVAILGDGKSQIMFSKNKESDRNKIKIDSKKVNTLKKIITGDTILSPEEMYKLMKDEHANWPKILGKLKLNHIDNHTDKGRKLFKNWMFNEQTGLNQYLPIVFFLQSGSFTGTFTTIEKDGVPKKEWDNIRDEYSIILYEESWDDLSKEQKAKVRAEMKRYEYPGEVTKSDYAGNYAFKNTKEYKAALKQALDNNITWNGEAMSEQDKQDIANAVKRHPYNDTNLTDTELKESKRRGTKLIWKAFDKMVEDDPGNLPFIAALLASTGSYQGHFMRTGALQEFKNKLSGANVEEHTQAVTRLAKYLFHRLAERTLFDENKFFDLAMRPYIQGALPKIFDNKLKGPGYNYQHDAGEYTYDILLGKKDAWIRYINPNTFDWFDPNVIVLANGNTLAQEYGVDISPELLTSEVIVKQNQLLYEIFNGDKTVNQASTQINAFANVKFAKNIKAKKVFSKAVGNARISFSKPSKGITILDFDDTLATTKSLVRFTRPDGTTGTLNAEEYASQYEDLLAKGYTFDFTEFDKLVKAKLTPLFNKALKLQKKFGSDNMFILTARPPAAQQAIHDFLKANGLNIPLKNITTLGNSTSEAKAVWVAEKVGEGYNDFYFADDALQNVQAVKNMLNQFDVKSKVQQAKIQFSKNGSIEFNEMLERTKGLPADYKISRAKARQRGKKKGNWKFWIPPSAEDFAGLMMMFQGKGKQGMEDAAWIKKHLLDPFAIADRDLNAARQLTAMEFKALRKQFPKVTKKLRKTIPTGDYTYGDAIRVFLWDKAGFEIPGLSNTDKQNMLELVASDPNLEAFADALGEISKKEEGYIAPDEYWMTKDIVADITEDGIIGDGRKQHFAEWQENRDIIFSEENLNKIEFIYGSNFREALEDILYRMENGSNRPTGQNRIVNQFINWLNGGISVVMNWNSRSAVLQTLSTVNFINWGDNNIYAAAKAFANRKQFWKDFVAIFNSDMLRQRRAGLRTTIESNELMSEVEGAVNPVRAAIRYLLRVGFTPTKIADSFAIAMGGASFYRNRINTYLKQGMTQAEAESKAWLDFQEIAEETQQSSRPDRISMQQASVLGRFILAFQNTPMQYMRLSKKEILDIVNGRYEGVTGPNSLASKIGKVAYYTAIQNVIFYSMQTALFAMAFGGDDDEEFFKKKKERVADNMADGILRGLGVHGAVISTIKNIILKRAAGDRDSILVEALKVSPPLSIKARQLLSADRTLRWNKDLIKEMETFDIDNPMWNAIFNIVEFSTNLPLSRMESKYKNVRESLNKQHEAWQRIAFFMGWAPWNFNIKNQEIEELKKEIKERKTYERKEQSKIKRKEKKKEEKIQKIEEGKKKQEQEKKEKKQVTCLVCKLPIVKGKKYCTIHEKKEQNETGKKVQCKKVKGDGKKCKMQTSNKSGLCYYHD